MSDGREFYGHAPTHCTICGSRWAEPCKAWCINSPAESGADVVAGHGTATHRATEDQPQSATDGDSA